jgi:hypothetical protein
MSRFADRSGGPRSGRLLLVLAPVAFAARAMPAVRAQGVVRVSVSSAGQEASGASTFFPAFSHDGRHVAFESVATDLVAGDANGLADVFVHDRDPDGNGTFDEGNGVTTRVSVSSAGVEGDRASGAPRLSATGRFVLFASNATNLVAGDTNDARDLFVHDRDPDVDGLFDEGNGVTTRVSVGSGGGEGRARSDLAAITPDGRFVAFDSLSRNLVANDRNRAADIFVHDRDPDVDGLFDEGNGTTVRVSVASGGGEANGDSFHPALSADARHVAFHSFASDLVASDSNGGVDVFVHDRDPDGNGLFDEGNGATTRLSTGPAGAEPDDVSAHPSLSADGRHIAFDSFASNLVAGDGNDALDAFVHDRDPDGDGAFDEGNGEVRRLSITAARGEGNADSFGPKLSADGLRVAFWSSASNLVPGDANGAMDVFVRSRDADGDGVLDEAHDPIARMSVDRLGREAHGSSHAATLSPDGRFAGFVSAADDLVAGDANGVEDVYVRDVATLALEGAVTSGGTVRFTVAGARATIGGEGWVLLSCSGTAGFAFASGRTIALTFDGCTLDGLRALPLLSSAIDGAGGATTTQLTLGTVPAGLVFWAAGLLIPGDSLADATATDPITFESE